ncbi:hypothetical protein E3P99_03037 [Wallemia hederae]|uniref:Mitochondrial distribution and morphology protein 12 n=1 Tax=Wallemia hederae TaxID=1540922 RepID=A0A4T0FJA3_9BASI|nr:hypothetical protein E3P99_03037 [Wallemia hederae]
MSVDIDYTKLDQTLADSLLTILNERLSDMQKPSILGHIEFTELSWGDIPPDIELEEITDLSADFDESGSEDEQEELEGEDGEGGEDKKDHRDGDIQKDAQTPSQTTSPPKKPSTIPNMQIQLRITHESDMRLTLLTNLLINFPSPGFMSLPVKLTVRGIVLHSKAVIGIDSLKRQVHLSLVEPNAEDEDEDSHNHILQSLIVESEIGDVDRHTLKNVRKVENFVLEYLRSLLSNEIVWPNYHTFILGE